MTDEQNAKVKTFTLTDEQIEKRAREYPYITAQEIARDLNSLPASISHVEFVHAEEYDKLLERAQGLVEALEKITQPLNDNPMKTHSEILTERWLIADAALQKWREGK